MYFFLSWCGQNGGHIIETVAGQFQLEREFFGQRLKEPRQIDAGATLILSARILSEYLGTCGFLPGAQENLEIAWREILVHAACWSEAYGREMDPVAMFLRAVFDLKLGGKFYLAETRTAFHAEQHIGFCRGGCWWLNPHGIYLATVHYWKGLQVLFPLSPSKLFERLAAAALIDTDQEIRGGKAKTLYLRRSSLTGRPRLLVLHADRAQAYLDSVDN